MVDDFRCCNLPCVHFHPACRLFHSRTISNIQYYCGHFCANSAWLAGQLTGKLLSLERELGSHYRILTGR
jgi:hypothetical protein